MDISTTRPILIGLMEEKGNGDPTMISVPDGGGTWHDLFCLIPGFLISSPPDIPHGSKKSTSLKSSTNCSIAMVLPVTFISPIPIPKPTFEPESYNHLSPVRSLREKKSSVREEEKVRSDKVKVASKERENIFVKKNSRQRSHDIKKMESESEEEFNNLTITYKQGSSSGSASIVSHYFSKLKPIIQNLIPSTSTVALIPPRTPSKSTIIGRLKRSRSLVSPPALKKLGNRKPKRGREFDVVRNAVVEYQAEQEEGVAISTSSNIYDILQHDNSDLAFDLGEET